MSRACNCSSDRWRHRRAAHFRHCNKTTQLRRGQGLCFRQPAPSGHTESRRLPNQLPPVLEHAREVHRTFAESGKDRAPRHLWAWFVLKKVSSTELRIRKGLEVARKRASW